MTLDLGVVRQALADAITTHTGLRALPAGRGAVNPPCVVILPSPVAVVYGKTMDSAGGATEASLRLMLLVTSAPPDEKALAQLDQLLGVGSGEPMSVPDAITLNPTLNGACSWCEPVSAGNVGRLSWAGVEYMGAVLTVSVGA